MLLMPKHNKRKNPLSHARKQDGSASNLWYRKAGLGYKAFVAYYATILDAPPMSNKISISTTQNTPCSTNGMSRAAKRRRKKKQGNEADQSSARTEPVANETSAPLVDTSFPPNRHPLLRAWVEAQQPPQLQTFVAVLCRPLPVTVRIRQTSRRDKEIIVNELQKHGFTKLHSDSIWQASYSKSDLSDELRRILTDYSQSGDIARQELGSMLPVHLLQNVCSSTSTSGRVLDLCASPGSKTLQALEVFRGTIVANDVNAARLDILRHAVDRSGMEGTERIQYTCQDASMFKLHSASGDIAKFRVIMCDVPCSGDGTCRKDPTILPQWKPSIGNNLHSVQLSILRRGLALLKPGGYLCYSTCSMYPVENEAVVVAALELHRDDVELVDCPSNSISGIPLEPGRKRWTVAGLDDSGDDESGVVLFESYEHAKKSNPDLSWLPSMWPRNDGSLNNQLNKCGRLWPQNQNSGGFFVALFHKYSRDTAS